MNIEDVKQLSDRELDVELSILTGFTARMAERLAIYGRDVEKYKNDIFYSYTANLANSREAQAKAIAVNANKYVGALYDVMYFDEGVPPDPTDNFQEVTYRGHGVAYMLQASPRQIAMAVYITLMEVQGQ